MKLDDIIEHLRQKDDPCIIMLMGASGAGKSSTANCFTELLGESVIALSSDEIRKKLTGDVSNMEITPRAFQHLHHVLRIRCEHNLTTVADSTNLKRRDRREVFQIAREADADYQVIGVMVYASEETCKERQNKRSRTVPEYVIEKHCQRFQSTTKNAPEEPFTELYFYDTEQEEAEQRDVIDYPDIAIANTLTAFDDQTIGSKVTNEQRFFEELRRKVHDVDFENQEVGGQAYIEFPEGLPHVSCGVGKATNDPSDYVIRKHRGDVGMYLKREKAAEVEDLAVVVYTREAYLKDPDVKEDEEEKERIEKSNATHVLVAVLASAEESSPLTPGRFVKNLAGGNREAQEWDAEEIRENAEEIVSYYDDEEWRTVAD